MSLNQFPQLSMDLWHNLNNSWQQTTNEWEDEVRTKFEHDYWAGTAELIKSYIESLENMVESIESARREIP